MPYLILSDRDGEFDRRELRAGDDAVVLGRSGECDICIRDILLSRTHCRIEPLDGAGQRWIVEDLGSKNGTSVGGETISRHVLSDGDVIRIGKAQVCFRAGAFIPAASGTARRRDVRPCDPIEALQGTVCGFQLFDMQEDSRLSGGFPIPKPRPAEPASYRGNGGAAAMVAELASSAWDTILSEPEFAPPTTLKVMNRPPARTRPPREIADRDRYIRQARELDRSARREIVHRLPPLRSESPDRSRSIPQWLARTYVTLACVVGAASLGIVMLRSLM